MRFHMKDVLSQFDDEKMRDHQLQKQIEKKNIIKKNDGVLLASIVVVSYFNFFNFT